MMWLGMANKTFSNHAHQPNHYLQQRREIYAVKLYYASPRNWNVGKYCMIFLIGSKRDEDYFILNIKKNKPSLRDA